MSSSVSVCSRPFPCVFTLIELLVVIAIIGILASLLLPAALHMYADDNDEWYPIHSFHPPQWGTLMTKDAPVWDYVDWTLTECPTIKKDSDYWFRKTAIVCGDNTYVPPHEWDTNSGQRVGQSLNFRCPAS